MKQLKKTKKLFYDKYVYKAVVITPLASMFRGANIENTLAEIDHFLRSMEYQGETSKVVGSRWNSRKVTVQEVRRDLALVHLLSSESDYFIRVEGDILSVYSSDESIIDTVTELYQGHLREVWRPENDKVKAFLLSTPKQIIRAEYSHKYKVTVNGLNDPGTFKQWAEKIPKLKIMPRNDYLIGGYFYVADQKTLSLCRIFLGDKIRRVDELRTFEEI
jgi:hypothetical protein